MPIPSWPARLLGVVRDQPAQRSIGIRARILRRLTYWLSATLQPRATGARSELHATPDTPPSTAGVVLLDASGHNLDSIWAGQFPDGDLWRSPDPTVLPSGFGCILIALPVGDPAGILDDLVATLSHRAAATIDGAPSISICVAWVITDADRLDALLAHDYRAGLWRNAYRLGGKHAWARQRAATASDAEALSVLDARLVGLLDLPTHRTLLAGATLAVLNCTHQASGGHRHLALLTQSATDPERWHGEDWLTAALGDLLRNAPAPTSGNGPAGR